MMLFLACPFPSTTVDLLQTIHQLSGLDRSLDLSVVKLDAFLSSSSFSFFSTRIQQIVASES